MVVFFLIARRMPVSTRAPVDGLGRDSMNTGILKVAVPVTLAALAFGPLWVAVTPSAPDAAAASAKLPSRVAGWQAHAVADAPARWKPVFVAADAVDLQDYRGDLQTVSAFAAVYVDQRQGKEMVGYANSVAVPLTRPSWRRNPSNLRKLPSTSFARAIPPARRLSSGIGMRWTGGV
jgi:hypothetical protein